MRRKAAVRGRGRLEYLVNWLAGTGAVTIAGHPVDLATAELCRSQLWQWRRNRVALDGGRRITGYLVVSELDEATERLADVWADRPGGRELLAGARNLIYDATTALRFTDSSPCPPTNRCRDMMRLAPSAVHRS